MNTTLLLALLAAIIIVGTVVLILRMKRNKKREENNQPTMHIRFPEHTSTPSFPPHGGISSRDVAEFVAAPDMKIMAANDTGDSDLTADTNNWDTVFAIKFADVNASIKKTGPNGEKAYPESFETSEGFSSAKGNFGPWQLSGGDGELLHMTVPILSGTAKGENKSISLDGVVVTIEIKLNFLPQPDSQESTNGMPNDLKVKTAAAAGDSDAVVSVTDVKFPKTVGYMTRAVAGGLMDKWFNENLQQFNHVFAVVNLDMKADKEQFQWLKPTHTSYAIYNKDDNPDDSVFGILSMTENRPKRGAHQVSANAIPAGEKSGFLISKERFLEKLVLPGVPSIFKNATANDFEMANAGTQIRNKNKLTIEVEGSKYTPTVDQYNCTITLTANEVVFDIKGAHVQFSPGIDIFMEYTGYSNIEMVTKKNGEKALNYKQARTPYIDHHVETAPWVTWTEVASSVAVAVATLGFGKFGEKLIERVTLRVIAAVIGFLVGELVVNIGGILTAIAEGNKDDLPSVDLTLTNATNAVKWAGSKEWTAESAQLNGSLQFGGDPHFTES